MNKNKQFDEVSLLKRLVEMRRQDYRVICAQRTEKNMEEKGSTYAVRELFRRLDEEHEIWRRGWV